MKTPATKTFQKCHGTMAYHHGVAANDQDNFRERSNAKPLVVKRSVAQETALYLN